MSNIDEALDLLQNKVRRLIMERLVREPLPNAISTTNRCESASDHETSQHFGKS